MYIMFSVWKVQEGHQVFYYGFSITRLCVWTVELISVRQLQNKLIYKCKIMKNSFYFFSAQSFILMRLISRHNELFIN